MGDPELSAVLAEYSANEMRKLKRFADPFIRSFGGLCQMDLDDFYSQANETLWTSAMEYDPSKGTTFEQYFGWCLKKKVQTIMTGRNREKRLPPSEVVRLDQPAAFDTDTTIGELTAASETAQDEDTESIAFANYKRGLSHRQRQILDLLRDGHEKAEICAILNISEKRYMTMRADMASTERHIRYLHDKYNEELQ